MATKAKVGSGNVPIMLGDKEYVLVPTLAAMRGVSRNSGGVRAAMEAILKLDIDMVSSVIQFGLGPEVMKEIGGINKLQELVFRTGLTDSSGELAVKCVNYLTMLTNAGRPLDEAAPDKDEEEGEDRPNP